SAAAAASSASAADAAEAPAAASTQAAAGGGAVRILSGRVSSGFGSRGGTAHNGLDIAAPIGTPIHVPLAGTVISSGPASGFGQWVRVRHDDGTITVYGHINRSLVSVGDNVAAGQEIAEVGNRGQSTGPHLHIEVVTPGGTKINPKPWLDEHGFRYGA
ncbi:MAG: M23 family metallopeptidase, partial [Pseudonocardia sp.]|nr:M23 family metallopeptidase [Pseudonocardia sp.]